jgi:hypothetical protein
MTVVIERKRTNVINAWPYGSEHHPDTVASNARLHAVPNTISRVSRFPNFLADTKSAHHAITPRLNVHQRLPYNPNLERATTGNGMWNTAPCRAFNATNGPTKPYPSQTQIHACHHDRPSWIIDDAIIHLYHHAHTRTNHGRRLSLTCSR